MGRGAAQAGGHWRARVSLGWPNTYSYTKSLGEQLVFAARRELNVTVVRPAVIESALADPFPGWNQGVNTSAPLTYLSGEGYRFYPARADLVLDVMPVDLVAHAMVPILAALLLKRHQPIYQLGTSDCNPLPMRRLVELTALGNRRDQRDGRRLDGQAGAAPRGGDRLAEHLRFRQPHDAANSSNRPRAWRKVALGEDSARARQLEEGLDLIAIESTSPAPWSRSIGPTFRNWSTPSTARIFALSISA